MISKVGFGGSCHWCTEAIFQSLKGVTLVEQGWVSPDQDYSDLSEAVIVYFDTSKITLDVLIAIHLHTHSCTSEHSMRAKYRSAVYTYNPNQSQASEEILKSLQKDFGSRIITLVLPMGSFRLNQQSYLDYYYSNPEKPFCKNIVTPKLKLLTERFSDTVDRSKFIP